MTKFSFEVPLDHLDDFHDLQDYCFALSMLFERKRYRRYIRKIQDEGLLPIWLDNSFNEKFESEDSIRLQELFYRYDCTRVVAPDSIYWSTNEMLASWLEMARLVEGHNVLCVVSSFAMYQHMVENGIKHFAVSYWVRETNFTPEELLTIQPHFLGLCSVLEILHFAPRSCDTSMPIKLALQNKTLRDWEAEGSPHIHTKELGLHGKSFFEARMTSQQIDLARRNIEWLKEAARNGMLPSQHSELLQTKRM